MKLKITDCITGKAWECDTASVEDVEPKAVAVAMWYDRSRREWVLYPVDADGNQIEEARYGFGKKEALAIKADLEAIYEIK